VETYDCKEDGHRPALGEQQGGEDHTLLARAGVQPCGTQRCLQAAEQAEAQVAAQGRRHVIGTVER
jgi:hypothetical protein